MSKQTQDAVEDVRSTVADTSRLGRSLRALVALAQGLPDPTQRVAVARRLRVVLQRAEVGAVHLSAPPARRTRIATVASLATTL